MKTPSAFVFLEPFKVACCQNLDSFISAAGGYSFSYLSSCHISPIRYSHYGSTLLILPNTFPVIDPIRKSHFP